MKNRLVPAGLLAVLIIAVGVTRVRLSSDHGSSANSSRPLVKEGDSLAALNYEANRLGINTPFLRDLDKTVSKSYGLPLKWAGKPGHVFVLVGKDGVIKWAKDYAIPDHESVMYVGVDELNHEISKYLVLQ